MGENGCIQTSTCPTVRVSITETAWTALGLKPRSSQREGASGGAFRRSTALQAGRVLFPMVSLEFFITLILPAALWPWGRLIL